MDTQQLDRGTSSDPGWTDEDAAALREIAGRMKHTGDLALLAAQSEEPERAVRYLVDTCQEYRGELQRLALKCATAASSLLLVLA